MYGFIHCCLEDMVLQLFGEAAWREILNVAGIKLRGASFLMHQVYDDETTFKLVGAASQVSGLPMEACLEEFGKHFLVYCQKNGYDQILRVLGSNLYDFLTNLDNLHDHLASIYPGMRAPSFRVTRQLESNGGATGGQRRTDDESLLKDNNETKTSQQNLSLAAGSMYLHYYSERNGLSPIVKGLVMAVAREFFSTDIVVTECKLLRPQLGHAHDHVVLKIDRRSQADILLDEQTSQAVAAAAAEHAEPVSMSPSPELLASQLVNKQPTSAQLPPVERDKDQVKSHYNQQQHKTMLSSALGDTMSKLASDSLINSEIMMQTFPFHVIFDRHFNLVQVGNALLRVTSLYWQRRQQTQTTDLIKFGDLFSIVRPKIEFTFDAIADHTNQVFVVKTRPLVLNADYLRSVSEGGLDAADPATTRFAHRSSGSSAAPTPARPPQSLCPMNRMAMKRRSCAPILTSGGNQSATPSRTPTKTDFAVQQSLDEDKQVEGKPVERMPPLDRHEHENDSGNELSVFNLLSLRLKGQMIILSSPINQDQRTEFAGDSAQDPEEQEDEQQRGPFCLYLCSPRVDHLNQLMECGVKMSDLALHDRARELMLMSHTHKEDREAVKKLDQATNDLKKMDTKLRQENKRTEEVLHNIFPAKIATMLSHGTRVESESFELVTCLYSDIIGFTKMCGSENVRPIDIVRLLNTLYLQFDNLTNIHGVYKVETIGDAYVIVGGLPEPLEDHADRCVRMGLDMVKVIATVRSPADNQPIQMRIGIHSGPVMAGIVGIRVPRYSLFGNTTTLANQLETHGVGGKIHISEFTLKNLTKRDRFVIEDNPNQISNFPIKTYFVTNYLGDQTELLKHEKILEEQLIKDFELMGNEVELVDNSLRVNRQHRGELDVAAAGQTDELHSNRQQGANLEKPISIRNNELNCRPSRDGGQLEGRDDEKQYKTLVLMDVEGAQAIDQRDTRPVEPQFRELFALARELTDTILAQGLEKYSDLLTLDRLLALLTSRYDKLGLSALLGLGLGRQAMGAAVGIGAQVTGASCPFCLDGRLDGLNEPERDRIKLIATAASVALTLTGDWTDLCHTVPSGGKEKSSLSKNQPTRGSDMPEISLGPTGSDKQISKGEIAAATTQVDICKPITCPTKRPIGTKLEAGGGATNNNNNGGGGTKAVDGGGELTSVQRALDGLRLERECLAEQVRQLRKCLNRFGSTLDEAEQQQQQHGGIRLAAGGLVCGSETSSSTHHGLGRPLVLSSNIQRMKRMDTLKRRKINRDQNHQLAGGQTPRTSPLSSTAIYERNQFGDDDDDDGGDQDEERELDERQRVGLDNNRVGARSAPTNPQGLKQKVPLTTAKQPQQSVLADHHQSLAGNNNSSRGIVSTDGGHSSAQINQTGPMATAAATSESVEGRGAVVRINRDGAPLERRQPSATSGRHLERVVVQGNGVDELESIGANGAGREGDQQQAASERPQLKQQHSTASASYIYQSFRSSLASLMNETVGHHHHHHQRQQQHQHQNQNQMAAKQSEEKRKKFSLNALSQGLSAAISSPFSSPKKSPWRQPAANERTRQSSGGVDQADGISSPVAARRPSSSTRSQSGSSGGGGGSGGKPSNQQQQQQQSVSSAKRQSSAGSGSGATPTNCSCLKSSGSDHSVESVDRVIQ